jgi:hypothetical protein
VDLSSDRLLMMMKNYSLNKNTVLELKKIWLETHYLYMFGISELGNIHIVLMSVNSFAC